MPGAFLALFVTTFLVVTIQAEPPLNVGLGDLGIGSNGGGYSSSSSLSSGLDSSSYGVPSAPALSDGGYSEGGSFGHGAPEVIATPATKGVRYAGPIVYTNEKPPVIHFPPPPKPKKGGYGKGGKGGKPKTIKYVPLPHHDLPILIYQSDINPPIHVVSPPPGAILDSAPPSSGYGVPSGGSYSSSSSFSSAAESYGPPADSYGAPKDNSLQGSSGSYLTGPSAPLSSPSDSYGAPESGPSFISTGPLSTNVEQPAKAVAIPEVGLPLIVTSGPLTPLVPDPSFTAPAVDNSYGIIKRSDNVQDVAVVPVAADTTPQKPAFVVVSSGVDLMPEESSPSVAFVAPLAENTGASHPTHVSSGSLSSSAPQSEYGAPSAPSADYGAPSAPADSGSSQQYGAPASAPSAQYGAPSGGPSSQYGAPSGAPSSQYGAPSGEPSSQYGAPSGALSSQYGAPASAPSSQYGAPSGAPISQYGAPASAPSSQYGAPASAPSSQYGAPSSGSISSQYGAPSSLSVSSQYGAPSSLSVSSQYGAPSSLSVSSQYGAPSSSAYGAPVSGPVFSYSGPSILSSASYGPPKGSSFKASSSFLKGDGGIPSYKGGFSTLKSVSYGPPPKKAAPLPHIIYTGHPPIHIFQQPPIYMSAPPSKAQYGPPQKASYGPPPKGFKSSKSIKTIKISYGPPGGDYGFKSSGGGSSGGWGGSSGGSSGGWGGSSSGGSLKSATISFKSGGHGWKSHGGHKSALSSLHSHIHSSISNFHSNLKSLHSLHSASKYQSYGPPPQKAKSSPKYVVAPKAWSKPPIIIYQGVRPPVTVYEKPSSGGYSSSYTAPSSIPPNGYSTSSVITEVSAPVTFVGPISQSTHTVSPIALAPIASQGAYDSGAPGLDHSHVAGTDVPGNPAAQNVDITYGISRMSAEPGRLIDAKQVGQLIASGRTIYIPNPAPTADKVKSSEENPAALYVSDLTSAGQQFTLLRRSDTLDESLLSEISALKKEAKNAENAAAPTVVEVAPLASPVPAPPAAAATENQQPTIQLVPTFISGNDKTSIPASYSSVIVAAAGSAEVPSNAEIPAAVLSS